MAGIGFEYGAKGFLRDTNTASGGPCKTVIKATNLAAPRSKIYQEFASPNGLTSFRQTINISNITLSGQSGLKFMSVDFDSYDGNVAQTNTLDLFIYPGAIPVNATQATTYTLAATWLSKDADGNVTNFYNAYSGPILVSSTNQVTLRLKNLDTQASNLKCQRPKTRWPFRFPPSI